MRGGRRTFWIVTTLLSIGFGEILFAASAGQGLVSQAQVEFSLSQGLFQGRLSAAVPARTYGYPLFLALCTGFQTLEVGTAQALVFHAQLVLLLLVAAAGARMVGQLSRSEGAARITYAAIACHPVLLARATEMFPDLLAALLPFLAVALAWKRDHPARPQSPPAAAAGSLFLVSAAVMLKPAMLPIAAAVVAFWIARQWIWREFRPAVAPLLLAALTLPLLPQLAIGARAPHGVSGRSIAQAYGARIDEGISRLKQATAIGEDGPAPIDYANPLFHDEKSAADFLQRRPLSYLATAALHVFAALDQDFLFSVVGDPHPWYRWPLTAANFLFLILAAAGAAASLVPKSARRRRDPRRFATVTLLVAAGSSVLILLPIAAENRFAVAPELFAAPFAAAGILAVRRLIREKRWHLVSGSGGAALIVLLACLRLSAWISAQAPRLR